MATKHVVVIDDEVDIQEILEYNLKREGFRVSTFGNGLAGLEAVQKLAPSIVLLDLMLPGMDGIEVCRRLQLDSTTQSIPIIMLTAKGEETDVILGLSMGADDYVCKPFGPKELLARIRAVIRRGRVDPGGSTDQILLESGRVVIDLSRHEVRLEGQPLQLTATELRLFHFMCSHPGRVFTRDHLINRAIGELAVVTDRNIDVHVRSIRNKLGSERDLIETVRGVGYRIRDQRVRQLVPCAGVGLAMG